jgi:hypothetical protein
MDKRPLHHEDHQDDFRLYIKIRRNWKISQSTSSNLKLNSFVCFVPFVVRCIRLALGQEAGGFLGRNL